MARIGLDASGTGGPGGGAPMRQDSGLGLGSGQAWLGGGGGGGWPQGGWASTGAAGGGARPGAGAAGGGAQPAQSTEYVCRAAYPSPARSLALGMKNLHLFRLKNTRQVVAGPSGGLARACAVCAIRVHACAVCACAVCPCATLWGLGLVPLHARRAPPTHTAHTHPPLTPSAHAHCPRAPRTAGSTSWAACCTSSSCCPSCRAARGGAWAPGPCC